MTSATALTGTARRRRTDGRLTGPRRPLPMLRLVWRQHWPALLVVLTLSAVAIGAMVIAELYCRSFPRHIWRTWAWQAYGPKYPDLAMQAIPLVAGLFVGVQLIAPELEDGTANFAWTQGYSKGRWALNKLAAASAVLAPAAAVLGLVFGWWYRLYAPATGYFAMHAFALYAPALAGWTVLGLSLGMASAALTRREGRAMALTLVGWIALHHYAIVGSPRSRAGEFWPLQFTQLAILLAIAGLLIVGMIVLIEGAPAVPGMPRLLRAVPGRAASDEQTLARQLGGRRIMAVPRAAWRQHRTGLIIGLAVLGIYGAILAITGLHIHAEPARLRPHYASLTVLYLPGQPADGNYLLALPLPFAIGAFLGASLTGPDLERGTVRFAWAQGVTRARWAAGKIAAVGCVLVAAAIAVGLIFQWWDQPYLAGRLADPWFGLYAPVYAGWMAVTLTAAALIGALARTRTFAAVACLVAALVAAAVNAAFLRDRYLPTAVAINRPAPADSLLVNYYFRHASALPTAVYGRILQNFDRPAAWTAIARELTRHRATAVLVYHPASQFWQLQAIESAALFCLALLFGAAAVWVVRRQES
jgi:ABC-type transport system involved in multi-copper enzyme maturation permease subunit